MPAPPMRMVATPHRLAPSPCLGQHNHEVLAGLLGMTREEIAALTGSGALA
jgi:benzylsuccinate CoA-transferase BbsF subunit